MSQGELLMHILPNSIWSAALVSFFYFVIPYSLKGYFKDENRTVFREIIWVSLLLVISAFGHRYINNDIFGLSPHSFSYALGIATGISIFPISIWLLLAIIRMTKENSKKNIDPANQLIEISPAIGNDKIKILLKNLMYIKSVDNYSEVYFMDNDNKLEKILLRISLGTLSKQLNSEYFIRSHRSYIVNLYNIKTFKRGVNSSKIYLKSNAIPLPVSKGRRKEVFAELNKLPVSFSM